jgi:hypothetical protein
MISRSSSEVLGSLDVKNASFPTTSPVMGIGFPFFLP